MTDATTQPGRASWLSTLGWAAYLGCSWTWCIGMFLPVLLVRDYGIWGFVVFAVPNVVGAGAMGWVLRTGGAARRIRTAHLTACLWFSIVTVAFQLYFLLIVLRVEPTFWVCAAWGIGCALGLRGWSCVLAWIISATALVIAWQTGGLRVPPAPGVLASESVLYLAPVCIFGFALCPYLDLTFLRTRAETTDDQSQAAFTVGFGVLFLAMIVGTLLYSSLALVVLNTAALPAESVAAIAIALHIAMQLGLTMRVHGRAIEQVKPFAGADRRTQTRSGWVAFGIVVAAAGMHLVGVALSGVGVSAVGNVTGFEIGYRLFMSFYGLVFPAYVWLCMIPARGETETRKPTRRKLVVLAVACFLAAPCYWMGFIERETIWLVPGLGVVLASRVFVRA